MSIVHNGKQDSVMFKDVFAKVIPALCEKDDKIIYLDADLMSCIGTTSWAKANPARAINCGIAEANMIGIACGLSSAGFKPIVHSFGPFASRRCFDQVFLSGGYAKNDITIIGSDPGVCATFNGGTHMPFEDVALYRTIPGATVLDITDSAMLESVLFQVMDLPGVKYLRVGRKESIQVFEHGTETPIGKAITVKEGGDAVIFASGIMVHEAVRAAEDLEAKGIHTAVVNVFTIKPLDEATVIKYASKTGAVVTAENHSQFGGLYSAVSECLAAKLPTPAEYVAVCDCFGEVGPQPYLQEQLGLTSANIVKKVEAVLKRK